MNEHEARNRAIKAMKLAAVCRDVMAENTEITPVDFCHPQAGRVRARVEKFAQVNPASEQTWQLVRALLEQDVAAADPFDGLPAYELDRPVR